MNLTDVLVSVVILALFFTGFIPLCIHAMKSWDSLMKEFKTVNTIRLVSDSFKSECAKPKHDMEEWKKMMGSLGELQNYKITEIVQGNILRALKLDCVIAGENIEIMGLCTP